MSHMFVLKGLTKDAPAIASFPILWNEGKGTFKEAFIPGVGSVSGEIIPQGDGLKIVFSDDNLDPRKAEKAENMIRFAVGVSRED